MIQARCVSERRGKYSCPSAGRFVPRTVRFTKKSGPATTAHKSSSSNKNCTRQTAPRYATPSWRPRLLRDTWQDITAMCQVPPDGRGVRGVPTRLRERACMFSHPPGASPALPVGLTRSQQARWHNVFLVVGVHELIVPLQGPTATSLDGSSVRPAQHVTAGMLRCRSRVTTGLSARPPNGARG
ncbi:hypothetical protein GY45DRAFT_1083173 [Cubamyces sp. BRFM 1775]|nr:hypothetical protein GY45DRAFT_1083173 [Cubamyces sp. BRFM 1775]